MSAVLAAVLLPALLFAGPQKSSVCPYCRSAPEILEPAGLVSHGPFPFVATNSAEVEKKLAYVRDFYWLESKHLRFGLSIPPYQIPEKEKKRYFAELTELQAFLPSINPKMSVLDPWLRIHLFAFRAEKAYDRFLELVGRKEADFTGPRTGGKYMGEGPYLGEKEKFEVLFLSAKAPFVDFQKTYAGVEHGRPQRWNFIKTDSLWYGCHTADDQLNRDLNLYSSMMHNLGHNFLDGYRHYSYDLPVWITEGFAHWFERLASEEYASFCFIESYVDFKRDGSGWPQEIRKRLGTGDVPSVAEILRKKSLTELGYLDRIVCWSYIDFMIRGEPGSNKFAAFIDRMKGRIGGDGTHDASSLVDVQRVAIKEIWGYSYPQFESAWRAFVAKEYALK